VHDAWTTRRAEVTLGADAVKAALTAVDPLDAHPHDVLDDCRTARASRALARPHDSRAGGFGGAPKFSASRALEWLLRQAARRGPDAAEALAMADGTLEAMARAALLTYAGLAGSHRHRAAAERALAEALRIAERHPRAAGRAPSSTEALLDGPREVAVVGRPDDPATRALVRTALLPDAPGAVLAVGRIDRHKPAGLAPQAGRPTTDGLATVYVCYRSLPALPSRAPVPYAGPTESTLDARPVEDHQQHAQAPGRPGWECHGDIPDRPDRPPARPRAHRPRGCTPRRADPGVT